MNDFTYEYKGIKQEGERLEKYEWDKVLIESTKDLTAKRVLYIGDSISCAIREVATVQTRREILFDGIGTSKGIDNPCFKNALKLFAMQQPQRQAVIFNNGLHGWHLDDETEYKDYYEDMVKFILSEFPGTPLGIVLTTAVADAEEDKRAAARNKVASKIAEKYSLKVIDLYRISSENINLLCGDGVHFQPEGYEILAAEVVRACCEMI